MASKTAVIICGSAASPAKPETRRPSARRRAASSATTLARRPIAATWQPPRAKRRTSATPSPGPRPTMTATGPPSGAFAILKSPLRSSLSRLDALELSLRGNLASGPKNSGAVEEHPDELGLTGDAGLRKDGTQMRASGIAANVENARGLGQGQAFGQATGKL